MINKPSPVILLEGIRDIPIKSHQDKLRRIGILLANQFPNAIFRSGNAIGSDFHFSNGIESVSHGILQRVVPYTGHNKNRFKPSQNTFSLSSISVDELQYLSEVSINASKILRRLFEYNFLNPHLNNKINIYAKYLLRDTLKVIGSRDLNLQPANFALLYVNENNPQKGGTGHTLKVCLNANVPVVTQHDFLDWVE